MTTKLRTIGLVLGAVVLAGAVVAGFSTEAAARDSRAPWNLTAVADTCKKSAQGGRPGVVEITTRLQDANVKTRIDVPCIIHLVNGAGVDLANVELTTQTLNLHDRDTGAQRSIVNFAGSTVTAVGEGSGILLELNDATDSLNVASTKITAPAGVVVRVAGQRGDENSGGSIRMAQSALLSDGPQTSGIQVLASDHSGTINLVNTTLDTPGALTVLAARCTAVQAGQVLNCSTDQVGRELGN